MFFCLQQTFQETLSFTLEEIIANCSNSCIGRSIEVYFMCPSLHFFFLYELVFCSCASQHQIDFTSSCLLLFHHAAFCVWCLVFQVCQILLQLFPEESPPMLDSVFVKCLELIAQDSESLVLSFSFPPHSPFEVLAPPIPGLSLSRLEGCVAYFFLLSSCGSAESECLVTVPIRCASTLCAFSHDFPSTMRATFRHYLRDWGHGRLTMRASKCFPSC